jgi:hypothetical protein
MRRVLSAKQLYEEAAFAAMLGSANRKDAVTYNRTGHWESPTLHVG